MSRAPKTKAAFGPAIDLLNFVHVLGIDCIDEIDISFLVDDMELLVQHQHPMRSQKIHRKSRDGANVFFEIHWA